jgi:hypothetical protein
MIIDLTGAVANESQPNPRIEEAQHDNEEIEGNRQAAPQIIDNGQPINPHSQ